MKQKDLTNGSITKNLLLFAFPLMLGNLLQQFYNIADTWIVGHYLGSSALAAVGSSYTLMVFLTSILLGLCMGSGTTFSIYFGKKDDTSLKQSIFHAFVMIFVVSILLNILVYVYFDDIMNFLRVPKDVIPLMKDYLLIIFAGIIATFLYNFYANLLRSVGNSFTPLVFLGISALLNIALDIYFVVVVPWGVSGAAFATVLSQYISGLGIMIYTLARFPTLRVKKEHMHFHKDILNNIANLSFLTCIQQSVMNFGILMVQGLVNSFGTVIMAAFAAAVKIDSFAYMPVQDFGNAFSTFIAQNYGANKQERIKKGIKSAFLSSSIFCIIISILVCLNAKTLMSIFIDTSEINIINAGVHYLWIEASCYIGIGILFLLYGYYRAINKPGMSVVLTIISLGTRVLLAYILSSIIGVTGIWVSIPIGWALADITGIAYFFKLRNNAIKI